MKTTIESYQNQPKNLQNLTNAQLHDLYLTVYDSIGEAIENDDLVLHDKILPILRTIKTEIQNRNSINELELRKLDVIGKINALDNRFEFDEISASEYKEISIEYKKELESIDFDLELTINPIKKQISTTPIITKNKRIKTLIKYAVCRCLSKKDSYEVFNKNFYKLNLRIKANEESILKAS